MSVAIIGILAALALAAMSKPKELARATICRNNLRQLAIAMVLYTSENDDCFPAANSARELKVEDWLYWSSSTSTSRQSVITPGGISASPILRYIGQFETNLFTCPSGKAVGQRFANVRKFLLAYTLSHGIEVVGNELHFGMASTIGEPEVHVFRFSRIKSASGKIMFAEEVAMGEDSTFAGNWSETSGWEWPYDPLSRRHRGKSNAAFADGSVAAVSPRIGLQREHYDPMF